MTKLTGFLPLASGNAVVLILGSMPGICSLQQQQYYAHPQNSFWFIMETLFNKQTALDYPHRIRLLKQHQIAVWDVLQSCTRHGSLDSAIKNNSIIANNFESFFLVHSEIRFVFFNGAKAEMEYHKRVLPKLATQFASLHYARLPSTSPAMATLTKQQKLQHWAIVKEKIYRHKS